MTGPIDPAHGAPPDGPEDDGPVATLRDAAPEDAPAIASLAARLAEHEGMPRPNLDAARVARDGFGPQAAFEPVVAEIDGRVVGHLLLVPSYDPQTALRGLYIAQMVIDPEHRRAGIGRALVAEAARRSRRAGGAYVSLMVWPGNEVAAKFYESLGARRESATLLLFDDMIFGELATHVD